MNNFSFPKHMIYQKTGYRRIFTRKIPDRHSAAIFQSSPLFEKGKIIVNYLVMSPEMEPLAASQDFNDIIQKLFLTQSRLRIKPKSKPMPKPPKISA